MHVVKNAWYVAAWSSELSERPQSRTLLGQSVFLVRKADGTPLALGNRCPHRFAPLHMGTWKNDTIQCAYHGLRFGVDGACVEIPTGKGAIPRKARVAAYRVAEKYGYVWIWMGEPEAADEALVPDFSSMNALSQRHARGGYLHVKANYQLMVDNLLDLSHVAFLHPALGTNSMAQGEIEIVESKRILHVNRLMPACDAPSYLRGMADPDGKVDHWLDMTLYMPTNMILGSGAAKPGEGRSGGGSLPSGGLSGHVVTPETDSTTHYFFSLSLDATKFSDEDAAQFHAQQKQVFLTEDTPMLEGCQALMGTTDLWALHPVLLATDAGPVRARRWLDKMILEESGQEQRVSA
jgi:phenylpropionate dioxygenase-like ring-hydroxylating dioxygenase large terminal subunit